MQPADHSLDARNAKEGRRLQLLNDESRKTDLERTTREGIGTSSDRWVPVLSDEQAPRLPPDKLKV